MFDLENKQHFSLRKLSVGLASVLIGISFFSTSQTVKADTVADQQASTVTNNVRSSDTQENGNTVESSSSDGNQVNNAKNNVTQVQNRTETKPKQDQTENTQQDFVPQTQEVNDSKDLGAEKGIVKTNSLQGFDDQSNQVAETSAQHNTLGSGQKTQSSQKFAKKVLATNLSETASSTMTNGGFDEATWGKLDVNDWQGYVQDGVYELTNYTGDSNHVIVPNEADFEKAGQSTNGLQVGITRDTVQSLVSKNQEQMTIAFSKTNDQKVKAIGTDWSNAFSYNSTLSKFDGSNLDVSSITDMSYMFENTQISDLTSLANWDVSNVINMYGMFQGNSISNLAPLTNWNTGNVTDMSWMLGGNKISNLTPLANWNTSKVTDMYYMFAANPDLIDLRPIANWNLSNVHDQESDQDRFACLFYGDTKLDLTNINNTPLMKAFLKDPDMLGDAIFITNNADLVKATINKDLPNLTNTAKRTITLNIPNATPKTIVQTINYKAVAPVQVDFDNQQIVKTYPVKESDWQLDTSKHNDAIIVNGQIYFASVKIPHINGYKAYTDDEIPDIPANPGDDIHQEVKYEAQDQNQTVHYTNPDGTPATNPDGSKVSKDNLNGTAHRHIIVETPDHKNGDNQGTTTADNKSQGTMPDGNKSQGTKTNGNKNDKKSAKNVVTKSGKGLDTKSSSKKITKNTLNSNGKGISNMVTTVSTIETANDNATSEGNIANTDNGAGAGVHTVQAATVNNGSKDLPQTGEKQGVMASIFGVLAAGLGILGLAGVKRKKKN